jgi:hypothetical protein
MGRAREPRAEERVWLPGGMACPRPHLQRLAGDVWLAAYEQARREGLRDRPTGPLSEDPEALAGAEIVARAGMHAVHVSVEDGGLLYKRKWQAYGARGLLGEAPNPLARWSAPRRAAVAVVHWGLARGWSIDTATRMVSWARCRGRWRLGKIPVGVRRARHWSWNEALQRQEIWGVPGITGYLGSNRPSRKRQSRAERPGLSPVAPAGVEEGASMHD